MTILTITYGAESPNTLIRSSRWNQNVTDITTFMNNNNIDGTDNLKVAGVQTANIANGAVTDAKIAGISTAGLVNGTALTNLPGVPSGAGLLPQANIPKLTSSGNGVDGAAIVSGLANVPGGAGVLPAANIPVLGPSGISGVLGSWSSKSTGSVIQATTDGFVICVIDTGGSNGSNGTILSDSSNPPTTVRSMVGSNNAESGPNGVIGTLICPVKKNDFYKITLTNTATATQGPYFIPLGS